ncbi:unnamed protein product [Parascedosporium putredinis]|uniref:Nephrocystin 3-like N-terminal domain-containing protein n=1 Tax=Parascedosporium putredinis TaxID=1442378 RepID=A0A9P1MAS6_9PEZI|nr:unnamed protein product [Parascedosporium putredinis]CAI7994893.1 unnamed protein product [Parascedosporium putredinis]
MFKFTDASPFRVFTTSTDRPCAVLEQYPDNLFVLTFHRAAHRRYAFVKPSVYVSSRSLAIPILGVDISPVPEQMPGNGFVAPVDSAVQRAPVVTKDESRRAPRSRRNLTTASCPSVLTDPRHTAASDKTELLFYFCTHQDEQRNSAGAVLRSLVFQLLKKRPGLYKHVSPFFEGEERTQKTRESEDALWIILSTLLRAPDCATIFCLIDGLDECDAMSIKFLAAKFRGLFSAQGTAQSRRTLHLAIVSRAIADLDTFTQIHLDPHNDEFVNRDLERQHVSLIHQSAREYLLRKEADGDPLLEEFRLKEDICHAILARKCLDHIEESELRDRPLPTKRLPRAALEKSPLLPYAVKHWPDHARRASARLDWDREIKRPFFQDNSNSQKNCRAFTLRKPANEKDGGGSTALYYVTYDAHEAVVRLLLDHGADVDAPCFRGITALTEASRSGDLVLVRMLVERGAKVNAGWSRYNSVPRMQLIVLQMVSLALKPDSDTMFSSVQRPGLHTFARCEE